MFKMLLSFVGLVWSVSVWGLSIQSEKGKIEFVAVGKPAMLKIKGTGKGPTGELKANEGKVSGDLKVSLESLDSGISLRDEHMKKKYLETEKFPDAILSLQDFEIPKSAGGDTEFNGTLKFHGIEHPVHGSVHLKAQDKSYQIKAHLQIQLSDYQIEIPSYAGIKVADLVDVVVETEVSQ